MTKVSITKSKLDDLALHIAAKSGEAMPMTIAEMQDAVDGIQTGGATLQAKTASYTSSGTAQSDTIEPDTGYDGMSSVDVSIAAAPAAEFSNYVSLFGEFYTADNVRKWRTRPLLSVDVGDGDKAGWLDWGEYYGSYTNYNAVASNTSVTPTESAQTIGGARHMMEGAVTVNAIPSSYVGSGITRRDSTDLSASGATVSVPAGYYASAASKAVASGSVTASATKGSVSNHSVQVTPSASVTAGYISSGASGTAVTVQASELVSGSQSITENDTYDVTNLAEVVVNVSGGGSTSVQTGTKTATLSSAAQSISFTGLSGNPTSFSVVSQGNLTTGTGSVAGVVFDGSSVWAMTLTSQAEYASTGYSKSYSSGTLTITSTGAEFAANTYKLVYTYGGSSSDIHTSDVQVGSGATSISFSGLSGKPEAWSCVFKSTFSTSSGYQRVMGVANDGTNTYGVALDSSAHALTSWTASYSGGTLTITSTGTNNGGYFHQPGYYQLTYAVDPNALNLQTKTASASTSSQTITADNGYDGLESVQINAVSQTNLTAANIKSGTTVSISNGSTNLWSVTGTYTGGGGGASIDTKTATSSNRPTSLSFTSMKGEPIAFVLRCTSSMSRSSNSTYYYVATMRYNGTNTTGNCWRMSNGNWTNITSGYSFTYSGTTLTLSSSGSTTTSPGCFYPGNYELVYVY